MATDENTKKSVVHSFDHYRTRGISAKDAASKLGYPLSTIYRWESQLRDEHTIAKNANDDIDSVSDAISVLVDDKSNDLDVIMAALKFVVWMRWPLSFHLHRPAMALCLATYAGYKSDNKFMNEIDDRLLKIFLENFKPFDLKNLYDSAYADIYGFRSYPIYNQPHTEQDVLADIMWYFLAYEKTKPLKPDKPTIAQAGHLLRRNAFRYHWSISQTTFNSFWRSKASTGPFLYVERFHSLLDWSLDPMAHDYQDAFEDLLKKRFLFRTYFEQCNWAVQRFMSRLSPRAKKVLIFPSFPSKLQATPFNIPELDDNIISKM